MKDTMDFRKIMVNRKILSEKRDILEQKIVSESPRYHDEDFDFSPTNDKSMSYIKIYFKVIGEYKDNPIYIQKKGKNKTVIIGRERFYDGSNKLAIISELGIEEVDIDNKTYNQVTNVDTAIEYRGDKYALSLYKALIDNGYRFCSDRNQYRGAKFLWKSLDKRYNVKVYDYIEEKYLGSLKDVDDSDVWSSDSRNENILLLVEK